MDDRHTTQTEQEQDPTARLLKIRVSLKGRPVRTLSLSKDVITVGRDPESDLFLDNPGISRHHLRFVRKPKGYCVEDLGSANGTYVNDELVQKKVLENDDVVRVGKFTLWITYEEDRRGSTPDRKTSAPVAPQGTTVLSTTELEDMLVKLRKHDRDPDTFPDQLGERPPGHARARLVTAVLLAFLLGTAVGAGVLQLLAR